MEYRQPELPRSTENSPSEAGRPHAGFEGMESDVTMPTASAVDPVTAVPQYEPRATVVDRLLTPPEASEVPGEPAEPAETNEVEPVVKQEFNIDDVGTWPVIPLDSLEWRKVQPYTVIEDIQGVSDFSKAEELVIARVSSTTTANGFHQTISDERLMTDRIGDRLRPKGFAGRVVDGQAVIIPYDAQRAELYKGHAHPPAENDDGGTFALGVVYSGILRSSRGTVGRLALETYYYPSPNKQHYGHGSVIRILGSRAQLKDVSAVVQEQAAASVVVAERVAKWALHHSRRSLNDKRDN